MKHAFGGKQRAGTARKGPLSTDPRDVSGKLSVGTQVQPLPELRETHSKASVEGRPLQDKSCSALPARRNVTLLGFPAKPPPATVPRGLQ